MAANRNNERGDNPPNILILCMDQWQTHMQVPDDVEFPAMRRLEAQGVSFDRQYCTEPICTPSRATMWTGVHAAQTGAYENTNRPGLRDSPRHPDHRPHAARAGLYTAFKGSGICRGSSIARTR